MNVIVDATKKYKNPAAPKAFPDKVAFLPNKLKMLLNLSFIGIFFTIIGNPAYNPFAAPIKAPIA